MPKIKELLSDWHYWKISFYVSITAIMLYILYSLIKNTGIIIVFAVSLISGVLKALTPLFIGLLLAYLISPIVELVDNRLLSKLFARLPINPIKIESYFHLRRTVSIIITYLFIIIAVCAVIYSFAFLIIGRLSFNSLPNMIESISSYFLQYETAFRDLIAKLQNSGLEDRLQGVVTHIANWIAAQFSTVAIMEFIGKLGGSILNIVLGIVVSVYLIKDKDFFLKIWRKSLHIFLPMAISGRLTEALSDINKVMSQFLRGQLLDALIIAILSSIALTAIKLDFAVFIGIFAGIANVIPYFGPILGMIPAAIIGLLSGGGTKAILAVALLLVIQQIDSSIIYPKVVGKSTGLHPVFILVSVTFAGYFFGILGMLLAVPITACMKLFLLRKIK